MLCTGAVSCALVFGLRADFRSGNWVATAPLIFGAIVASYCAREILIDHLSVTQIVMNTMAALAIAAVLFLPRVVGPGPLWLRALTDAYLAGYIGCYFWLLSDERLA